MRKVMVIYNPAAGRFPVKPFLRFVEKELTNSGWQVDIAPTQSGPHTVELGKQAVAEEYDAAFAIGGDGTIGQVATGLLGSETALGVLPAGTSNVWAQELGLPPFNWAKPWRLRENARTLANAPIRRVDMGQCNEHYFMMWAGMGLDAMAIHAIEPRVRLEKFFAMPEYAASTIWKASQWGGTRLRIWVNDEELEDHYILAVANNIRRYMGGYSVLSPEAHLDDGLLDLFSAAAAWQTPSALLTNSGAGITSSPVTHAGSRLRVCGYRPMPHFSFIWTPNPKKLPARRSSPFTSAH